MKKSDENTAYGIASIICGIISIFILGIVFAPLAILFGAIGVNKGDKVDKTISMIGLILGVICTAICLFAFLLMAK